MSFIWERAFNRFLIAPLLGKTRVGKRGGGEGCSIIGRSKQVTFLFRERGGGGHNLGNEEEVRFANAKLYRRSVDSWVLMRL